jgi:hypothetical protein
MIKSAHVEPQTTASESMLSIVVSFSIQQIRSVDTISVVVVHQQSQPRTSDQITFRVQNCCTTGSVSLCYRLASHRRQAYRHRAAAASVSPARLHLPIE